MPRISNEEKAKRRRQEVVGEIEDILLEAAPAAAKKLAGSIKGSMPLGREELAAVTLVLERTMGKSGTSRAPDPDAEKIVGLLSELKTVRETSQVNIEGGDEDMVEEGEEAI